MSEKVKICVLIPAHNESRTIGTIVHGLRQKQLDVFVIDDGSQDKTGEIAQANGAILIRNDEKSGKGSSLKRGFQLVIKKGYDGVITMDADGQHSVGDIEKFIELAQREPRGIITGNRMADHKSMPVIRFLTNKIMSLMISLACSKEIPDTQCGYRYIGCDVLKKISLKSSDFEIETEILMKAAKKRFSINSVSIKTIYRDEKSKIRPFKDTLRFFSYFMNELFSKE